MFGYTISGLGVASDVVLPGLIETAAAVVAPDVRIERGSVPDQLPDATDAGPNWQLAKNRFLLRIPGIVRMHLSNGSTIQYALEGATQLDDAAIFISGSGFGLLMHQRGHCILHASAVAVAGKAVLFCGASGAGKSTLAAALSEAGYPLLADDQCGLSGIAEGDVRVFPDGRAMKLWQNAIDHLDLDERSGAPVRTQLQKYYVQPERALSEALPLAAVYVLQEARSPDLKQAGSPISIERLNLADAAQQVRANAYRPAMVRRLDQEGLYLQAAAAVCGGPGGVNILQRPLGFDHMPQIIAALADHWQGLAG